jgi:hypothetical protein
MQLYINAVSGVISLTRLAERKLPQAVNLYRSRCPASSRPSGLNATPRTEPVLPARARRCPPPGAADRERVIRDNARESGLPRTPSPQDSTRIIRGNVPLPLMTRRVLTGRTR